MEIAGGLVRKVGIKAGQRVLLVGVPETVLSQLASLPTGASLARAEGIVGDCDAVLIFAKTKAELEGKAPAALDRLKFDGLLWGFYPKGSSKAQTDLTRDQGWDCMTTRGLEGVAAISVDGFWSGMRFRPSELVRHS